MCAALMMSTDEYNDRLITDTLILCRSPRMQTLAHTATHLHRLCALTTAFLIGFNRAQLAIITHEQQNTFNHIRVFAY